MDPVEHYQKIDDAVKVVDLYSASKDKQEFINHIASDNFIVKDPSLKTHATVWDHLSVFNSDPNPDHKFREVYGRNFSNYNVPNRLFWKNYLGQIQSQLDYLASARSQVEEFKNQTTDNLVRHFSQSGEISPEQLAAYQRMNSQQRGDFIDKMLKGNRQGKQPYGAYAGSGSKEAKGIKGAKQPNIITSHPVATPEEHKKLQDLGLEKKYEPQKLTDIAGNTLTTTGTVNEGDKFLTDKNGNRVTTAGVKSEPGQLLGPLGTPLNPSTKRTILYGPNDKPFETGPVVIRSEESTTSTKPTHKTLPLAKIYNPIIHPTKENRALLTEAAFQAKMGLYHAKQPIFRAAEDIASGFGKEIASIPFGTSPPPDNSRSRGSGFSPGNAVNNARGAVNNTRNIAKNVNRAKQASTEARLAATVVKQGITKFPLFWIVVGVIVLLVALFFFLDTNDLQNTVLCGPDTPCGSTSTTSQSNSNIVILKNGPDHINCCDNIDYNISVSYTGPGTADVNVVDTIPDHTTIVDAHGGTVGTDPQGRTTVTWPLTGIATGVPTVLFLTIVPDASIDNTWAINSVTGTAVLHFINLPTDGDFETLVRGQGRNTQILGDLNSFIATVHQNNPDPRLNGRDAYLTEIYNLSQSANVNPLIVLTLWGEESGYSLNGASLGCDPHVGGFPGINAQIGCGVNTLNHWLTFFEQNHAIDGTYTEARTGGPGTCTFDDATIYALEKYGPVCLQNDGNSHFHANFASIFRQFLGY